MRLVFSILILSTLIYSCGNKEISSEHLTTVKVIRNTQNSASVNRVDQKTYPTIKTQDTPLKNQNVRYHIIVSSFKESDKARAERMISQLKAKNYPAELLYSAGRYRVSIESFPTEREANIARDEYRTITDRQDIWVHKTE